MIHTKKQTHIPVIVLLLCAGAVLTSCQGEAVETPFGGGGGKIAFISERDGGFDIYLMDTDGSNVQQMTDNDLSNYSPAWSPDGNGLHLLARILILGRFT